MSKQDRQGVRTATDLEMKYHFGQAFSEMRQMLQTAESALATANNAQTALGELTDYVDTGLAGKAPAGYGLGAGGKSIASGDDLNNYKVGGFYQFTSGVANAPVNYGMMLVIPGTGYSNDTFQYVFSRYPTNNMAIRQLFEGTWGAWEWVNPPMAENTEYRTTERYKGKPVYALLKNLGAMPNSTTKTIYDLAVNVDNLVSADLTLDKGESRCIDNRFTELRWYIGCYSKPYIEISSTNDKSAYTGYLLFKYTKTTN